MAENFCKYYKLIKQVSYNNGQTWSNVDPQEYEKGDLYEEHSTDCGSTVIYRWVDIDGEYTCVGTTKYQKTKKEVSYDGITWEDVSPPEYGTSSVIEYRSTDCGYVPQEGIKFKAAYSNGTLYTLQCNYEEELTYEEIREFTTPFSAMTSAEIGNSENNCVKKLGDNGLYNAVNLTSVTIHNGVEKIGQNALMDCTSLTSVYFPETVNGISYRGLYGSSGLTSIIFVNADSRPFLSFRQGNNPLSRTGNCPIYVPPESYSLYKESNPYEPAWDEYRGRITPLTESQSSGGTKLVANYSDGTTHTAYKYGYGDTRLEQITVRFHTASYEDMTSVSINNVKSIRRDAFKDCINLTSLTISNSVEEIGQDAFENCISLKNLSIPSSVTSIYIDCQDKSVGCDGSSPFFWCQNLESISVDSNNTVYDSRGGCNAIIKTSTNKLLIGCKNTVIPNTVTSIMGNAFEATASGLTSITIPSSVTEIGSKAFAFPTSLESVIMQGTTPPTIGTSVFSGSGSYPIYVPAASVEAYKTAVGWREYADRIFGY